MPSLDDIYYAKTKAAQEAAAAAAAAKSNFTYGSGSVPDYQAPPPQTDSAMSVDERAKIRQVYKATTEPDLGPQMAVLKPEQYPTKVITDRYGNSVETYTSGPLAGTSKATGEIVIQGVAPAVTPTPTVTPTPAVTPAPVVTPSAPVAPPAPVSTVTQIVPTAAEIARADAFEAMKARFKQYGLESLAAKIKDLAISGASETTVTLQLQETPEYKTRFAANESRIKKGLQVLSPGEYLTMEDTYRQTLRAYGLTQFDNDAYVKQFIANDVSPTELSNRVVTAVQRVRNADPAIALQLREYYGIGQEDLVAYVLDPEQQFQKIQRQVAASEIGVAAGRQGLKAGVGVAEQLAAQGVTQAEAQKGYATIADILPTAEKLSSIYGTTMDTYGQSEAEQEVFNSLASAQRTRQKLTAREVASFSGAAGTGKASLASQTRGQIQNPAWTYRPHVAYKTESRSQPTSPSGI